MERISYRNILSYISCMNGMKGNVEMWKKRYFVHVLGKQDHRKNAKHILNSINEYRSQSAKIKLFTDSFLQLYKAHSSQRKRTEIRKNSLLVKLPVRRANSSKLGRSSPTSNSHTQGSGETASIFPCQFLLCFWIQASSSSGGRSSQKALQVPIGFPQKQPRLNPFHISYSCCSTPQ